MKTRVTSSLLLTLLLLPLACLSAASGDRSVESVRIDLAKIEQTIDGEEVIIRVRIPDAQVNSAQWPVTVKDEIGRDVIVVRLETGNAIIPNNARQDEVIKLKRTIGKNYKVLARDRDGRLSYVCEFKVE
jgi:hypothetical protein